MKERDYIVGITEHGTFEEFGTYKTEEEAFEMAFEFDMEIWYKGKRIY